MACKNCNSENIAEGVLYGLNSKKGMVGPKYRATLYHLCEATYVDLCNDCGEINRMYIKPKKKRDWLTREKLLKDKALYDEYSK